MRQAGTISNSRDAQRLTAYLITQGIDAVAEPDGPVWTLWVRDEDFVPKAKDELARYQAEPNHERYNGAEKAAAELQKAEAERRARAQQNVRQLSGNWNDGRVKAGPLTRAIIMLCGVVFLLTDLGSSKDSVIDRTLTFVERPTTASIQTMTDEEVQRLVSREGMPQLANIRRGELWRLITPIFLHFSILHILFNMLMFHSLASLIETRCGTARLGLLILGIALVSNVGQALMPEAWDGSPHFGGMSGVVYGLLGYAWMLSRYQPQLGIRIRGEVVFFLLLCMAIGWVLPAGDMHMANWAHAFGFLSGVVFGFLPSLTSR